MSTETVFHEPTIKLALNKPVSSKIALFLNRIAAIHGGRRRARPTARIESATLPSDSFAGSGFFSEGLASSAPFSALLLKKLR